MTEKTTLSIIVPVRNAASTLIPVIEECLSAAPRFFDDYEIIIVDDQSDDRTLTIANNLAANYEPIMIIRQFRQQGYGSAFLNGVRSARGSYILMVDASGQVAMSEMGRLVPYIGQYDIITGYRLNRPSSRFQAVLDTLFTRLVNRLFKLDLHDARGNFRCIRSELLQQMDLRSTSSLLPIELYVQARNLDVAHIQVGVHNRPQTRDTTSLAYAQPGVSLLPALLRMRLGMRPSDAPGAESSTPRARPSLVQALLLGTGVVAVARGVRFVLRRRRTP